jgi:hypothetical protein
MEASGTLPGPNRVFALTANARDGQIKTTKDAGMDGVIVSWIGVQYSVNTNNMLEQIKPYKLAELMEIINGP